MKSPSDAWAYCDTSALARRYIDEPRRAELQRLIARRRIVSSVLLPLELQSAVARRVHQGKLATVAQPRLLERIAQDRQYWTLVDLADAMSAAESLLEAHRVRTLDAIHVASAQVFASQIRSDLIFVTADRRQEQVASSVGLRVRMV